jgi:hypothetical protein
MSAISDIIWLMSPSILSGSDGIRTMLGGYYEETSGSNGATFTYKEYLKKKPMANFVQAAFSDSTADYTKATDASTLVPNKRFPIQICGNASVVEDDMHWKAIFLGGTYNGAKYHAAYDSNNVYDSYNDRIVRRKAFPVSRHLEDAGLTAEKITCQYEINRYNSKYFRYVSNETSELLLPNCYFLSDISTRDIYDTDIDLYPGSLLNLVTCEGSYKHIDSLFDLNVRALRQDIHVKSAKRLEMLTNSKQAYLYSFLNTTYMSAALLQVNYSTDTRNWARKQQRSILFDIDAMDLFHKTLSVDENMQYFPYHININFTPGATGKVYESIKDNDFSSMFIKTLFGAFNRNTSNQTYKKGELRPKKVPIERVTYPASDEVYAASEGVVINANNTYQQKTRACDFVAFMEYCQNVHYDFPGHPPYMFAGESSVYRNLAKGGFAATQQIPTGNRYIKSVTTSGVISDLIADLSSSADYSINSLEEFLENSYSETETLAYRIKKSSTSLATDSAPYDDFIQDYWFMNTEMQEFNFYDTQIKYNVPYSYEVFAYKLVRGFKYKYSDLLLSRQLSCEDLSEDRYGLEFYAAATGLATDSIYNPNPGRLQRLNDYATMAQTTSEYPFIAEMYLEIEPFVKILEEPFFQKTITVTDHWPSKVFARPYQVLNSSQQIGFELTILDHEDAAYIRSFDPEGYQSVATYLESNNLLEGDKVTKPSVSPLKSIEVYRTTTMPTSLSDFKDRLIKTINISVPNSAHPYKTNFFENIITTNQKYYYAFRIINELGVAGHFSDICQAELINDGGYLYCNFKTINKLDLEEKVEKTSLRPIRKLLQLKPTIRHTTMNTSEADFQSEAGIQIDNISIGTAADLIWDKTFKFRLTSKKTNKKIDLNITYKLESEY